MREPAPNCRRCPRLVSLRREIRRAHPEHHAAPVHVFGPADAALLVIGLAPGLYGANATGRPFTGDDAGGPLYATLHAHGFCNAPRSDGPGDGLVLQDCRITNAVKCLPPDNRPVAAEINTCNRFLADEVKQASVLVTLGGVAHKATVRALGLRQADHRFGHGATYDLPSGHRLIASYHCSRYNRNTRRLTPAMLDEVFARARAAVDAVRDLSSTASGAS
ncbi:uracil-DNA glycosylase [Salinisphaera hydrothermalis]|uniref:uracil-DNA glycosylase n=1 Tax=Salinisphaera hydrothermalis TaxID=563188 RepID=UPI003342388C